jgi:hypothetical protein
MINSSLHSSASEKPEKSQKNRRRLNPFIRYMIIALWGTVLACIVFYGLKKIGY